MKKLQLFYFPSCPYCRETLGWIEEVKRELPQTQAVQIEMIDEKKRPDIADQYDYYYVPTFFLNGEKVQEGACKKEIVRDILLRAAQ